MDNYSNMEETATDLLTELGNVGTGNAVTALAQLMGQPVDIEVPRLRIMKYQEFPDVLGALEDLVAGILVEMSGEMKGVFLFLLKEDFTRTVLEIILGGGRTPLTSLDEMEHSLLCELGNIMCGSYVGALAQLLNMELDVSVPELCVDMGGAILNLPLTHLLEAGDEVLVIENIFYISGKSFEGKLLFLPEWNGLKTVLERFGAL